jgi:hypothetical protein
MSDAYPVPPELIAPCGLNCAVCSRYLAYLNGLDRSQCPGCRVQNQACTYLFEKCTGINNGPTAQARFCFECDQYPCPGIERMDKRYRTQYGMSIKENLEQIREMGLETMLEIQVQQHRCGRCGGLISVHNRKCFQCDPVTRLIEKRNIKY